ncbi:MAG TPA: HAEPLYID family protein [Chitinophagaceae bacterium]|nr:HAEPLYID family protein [Chitinophagaceae bacterium]
MIVSCYLPGKAGAQNKSSQTDKVTHAEPLYFDLVRDLGARKGERELNIGSDFTGTATYNKNTLLAEYEFAPVDHLGFEVEADVALHNGILPQAEVPGNKLECIRLSAQYSFLVSPRYQATLAAGYTQIVELTSFRPGENKRLISGTVYNPFFVAAKRWGKNFHTLIYCSPLIGQYFGSARSDLKWQLNTSLHYTIPKTKNFVGIECNQEIRQGKTTLTLRPQVKIQISKNLAAGLVAGLPLHQKEERISSFVRIIYEL